LVTVEGTGFMSGATATFSGTKMTVFETTFESSTKLDSLVVIDPQAGLGARDLAVENTDKTFTSEVSAFNITANPGAVAFSNVWFDSNKFQTPFQTIQPSPLISFEVATTALTGTITRDAFNARLLVFKDGFYTNVYSIPSSRVTIEALSANKKSGRIKLTLPADLPSGIATIEIYGEDSLGNVGRLAQSVEVASSSSDDPVNPNPLEGAGDNDLITGLPRGSTWNPATGPALIQMKLKPGTYLSQGFDLIIFTTAGADVAYKKHFDLPVRAAAADKGLHFNIQLKRTDFASHYFRNCIALAVITDPSQGGKIIGKFKLPIFAK